MDDETGAWNSERAMQRLASAASIEVILEIEYAERKELTGIRRMSQNFRRGDELWLSPAKGAKEGATPGECEG